MTGTKDISQEKIIRIDDEAAFERTFREHYAPLCRYALGIVGDADNAEEVVQDVFMRVWEKRETLTITVSVKAYLYRAVHNSCLNLVQRNKAHVRLDEAPLRVVHAAEEPGTNTGELERAVADALATLPKECRRVFELSRFEELKYREIADLLGISIKTVENQVGKALRLMRERLAPFLHLLLLLGGGIVQLIVWP